MRTRKLVAGLLATAMVITGISIAPKNAEAAAAKVIVFEEYYEIDKLDNVKKMIGVSAPLFDGIDSAFDVDYEEVGKVDATEDYLFGGWYLNVENDDGTYSWAPVSEAEEIKDFTDSDGDGWDDNTDTPLCAKWVPASILSVKAQNTAGVTADSTLTNTRVISAVDSLDYESVGFEILLNNKTSLGELTTTKVYEALKVSDTESYRAADIFGASATHFVVWRLEGILKTNFEKIIYVRPYWVTPDGVKVDGLAKYVHVEDGYNKYISVPVNLKDYLAYTLGEDGEKVARNVEVAAGVFEISYEDGLALVEDKVEVGRVFEEMEFADKGSSVKFAANVADIGENVSANDIYVNLRFILDSNGDGVAEKPTNKSYDFEIKGDPDFCDNGENKVTVDIWDVLY